MCIPPFSRNSEENVERFGKMRKIFVDNRDVFVHNVSMDILSMGMSGDYTDAISQGSTMVRIGQAFFGERTYN